MTTLTTIEPDPLTLAESKRLIELEHIVEAGINHARQAGAALREIQESRLYRIECVTFEEYCDKRWGVSKGHAYRLIMLDKLDQQVEQAGLPPTDNSKVSREFSVLPAEERVEAYREAVEKSDGEAPSVETAHAVVQERRHENTLGFSAQDILDDKDLAKALNNIGRVCGHDVAKSVRDGSIPMTRKDVMTLIGHKDTEMKRLMDIVGSSGRTLKWALSFTKTMPSESTTAEEFVLYALWEGGRYEATIAGWNVCVSRN